jgi:hypothetical protein
MSLSQSSKGSLLWMGKPAIKNQNEKFSSGVIQKGAPEIFR